MNLIKRHWIPDELRVLLRRAKIEPDRVKAIHIQYIATEGTKMEVEMADGERHELEVKAGV